MKEVEKAKSAIQKAISFVFLIALTSTMIFGMKAMSSDSTKPTNPTEKAYIVTAVVPEKYEKIAQNEDKLYYDVPLSDSLQDYIFSLCDVYNIPPKLVIAIIENESNYKANATGEAGERGYMQIHPINFGDLADKLGITDFYDPEQNILCGIYLLAQIYSKYDTRNEVLMCYNCGEAGACRLWKQGITETGYCRKINKSVELIREKS